MDTICINCPMGCPLHIEEIGGEIKVEGYTCKRGLEYGKEEYSHPKRSITTLVNMEDGGVASCKTTGTVPKEKIFDVVKEIGKVTVSKNISIGDVIIKDVLHLGVDVVITGRK